jgi:Histidinol dehydrogenase
VAFSNRYAPEHLIVNVADAEAWLPDLDNAGSVFLGAPCICPVTCGLCHLQVWGRVHMPYQAGRHRAHVWTT